MPNASKLTIVLVEDDQATIDALRVRFVKEGFRVIRAKNGVEGLRKIERERPDIILLDLVMPVMDGLTMLEKLRATPWGEALPVIVLTNWSEVEKIEHALRGGVYDYLVKTDWTLDAVVRKVKDRLNAP